MRVAAGPGWAELGPADPTRQQQPNQPGPTHRTEPQTQRRQPSLSSCRERGGGEGNASLSCNNSAPFTKLEEVETLGSQRSILTML